MTKIFVELILLMTNKRSVCIGEHNLPVPFTYNPLNSFSLNGPLEKSSNRPMGYRYVIILSVTTLFFVEKYFYGHKIQFKSHTISRILHLW